MRITNRNESFSLLCECGIRTMRQCIIEFHNYSTFSLFKLFKTFRKKGRRKINCQTAFFFNFYLVYPVSQIRSNLSRSKISRYLPSKDMILSSLNSLITRERLSTDITVISAKSFRDKAISKLLLL